jgi:hypothetical protein
MESVQICSKPFRRGPQRVVSDITRVAEQLGENEDWLRDVASEMEINDGVIWSMAPEKTASWRSPTSASRA